MNTQSNCDSKSIPRTENNRISVINREQKGIPGYEKEEKVTQTKTTEKCISKSCNEYEKGRREGQMLMIKSDAKNS